ncbi:MAG: transposase [Deltaproteobacteria bacterium]|nr:transposase [Deltaproteobacteria bacterium]
MRFYRRNLPHYDDGVSPVFVTFRTHGRWVLPPEARDVVLAHCVREHGVRVELYCAVVMPDHVHLLFQQREGHAVQAIMSSIKGASAHSVNRALGRRGRLWQDESYDRLLRNDEGLLKTAQYICNNPLRAGLPADYRWIWRAWMDTRGSTP